MIPLRSALLFLAIGISHANTKKADDRFLAFGRKFVYFVSTARDNDLPYSTVRADSINVETKYRDIYLRSLQSVFGEKAAFFSYSPGGNLLFNGNKKDFTGTERVVLNKLRKVMNSKTITHIIYEKSYKLKSNANTFDTLEPLKWGGEFTLLKDEKQGLSENYIVVDTLVPPPVIAYVVTKYYYREKDQHMPLGEMHPHFIVDTIVTNPYNCTWHGIAHIVYFRRRQDKVIQFDDKTREINKYKNPDGTFAILPLKPRKPDEKHNRTSTTGAEGIYSQNKND